jgi:acyl-homoserine lactone synthase
MIHCITPNNRGAYESVLRRMHADRWAYLVKGRGWSDLGAAQVTEGLERDRFDDARAHYLVAFAEDGSIALASRYRPIDDGCVLMEACPQAVENPDAFPANRDTWELSRFIVAPAFRGEAGRPWRRRIHAAGVELLLSRGATAMVALTDSFLLSNLRGLYAGKLRLLGLPVRYDTGEAIAFCAKIDAELMLRMREAMGEAGRVPAMFELPATDSVCDPDPFALEAAWRAALHAPALLSKTQAA